MFGSQFFGLDISSEPPSIRVAHEFWVFWVIVIVVTSGVAWMKRKGWVIRSGGREGGELGYGCKAFGL
jgi:hypothetical protein